MTQKTWYVLAELIDNSKIEVFNEGLHGSVGTIQDFMEDDRVKQISITKESQISKVH